MFLTQKEYLTFIADPKQYERVSALLHDEFKSRGLQYFVPAGGYFAATRTTGRTVVACARVSPLLGSTGSYLIRNIVGDPTKLLKMVVRELRARGGGTLYAEGLPASIGMGFEPSQKSGVLVKEL